MEMFAGTTTYINPKNHHTWGYPVYVLDAIFQGNISGIPKYGTLLIFRNLSWSLTISLRINTSDSKTSNWSFLTPI